MKMDELLEMRQELDETKSDIDYYTGTLYTLAEDLKENILAIEEQCQKLNHEQSRQEFDQWIQHGITLGAKFEIEKSNLPGPLTVIGIASDGFVAKDANGKEYTLFARYLKRIDLFKVVK